MSTAVFASHSRSFLSPIPQLLSFPFKLSRIQTIANHCISRQESTPNLATKPKRPRAAPADWENQNPGKPCLRCEFNPLVSKPPILGKTAAVYLSIQVYLYILSNFILNTTFIHNSQFQTPFLSPRSVGANADLITAVPTRFKSFTKRAIHHTWCLIQLRVTDRCMVTSVLRMSRGLRSWLFFFFIQRHSTLILRNRFEGAAKQTIDRRFGKREFNIFCSSTYLSAINLQAIFMKIDYYNISSIRLKKKKKKCTLHDLKDFLNL